MNTIIIAADAAERDRLFANTVSAMRQSLGITVPQLSRTSSIPCLTIEAIEAGATMTHAEHHDIAVALSWLSSIHAGTVLTTSPRRQGSRAGLDMAGQGGLRPFGSL